MEVSCVRFCTNLLLFQGLSRAGNGLGIEDQRSMLVVELVRVVDESGACPKCIYSPVSLTDFSRNTKYSD